MTFKEGDYILLVESEKRYVKLLNKDFNLSL